MGAVIQSQDQKYQALLKAIARIRESLELDTIFKATVTEVRQLLEADRVALFYFNPDQDWIGEVVCEDVKPGIKSALTIKVHDHCFSDRYASEYQQGRISAIENIYTANLTDCYLEILAQFQIRANLVAPVIKGENLWGLLCIHQCTRPRHWETSEIEFIMQISANLGVALQHAEYLNQVQKQMTQITMGAEREKTLATIVDKIRCSLDLDIIFNTTTQEVLHLFQADRVSVYRFAPDWSGDFVAESVVSGWKKLLGISIRDTHFQETKGGRYIKGESLAVDDIYQAGHNQCHIELLEYFEAKAYIIVPICQGEKLWGLLAAYQNSSPRHWEEYEIKLLTQIGVQLAVGIQQAELLAQTKTQAEELTQILNHLRKTQSQLIQSEKMASLGQLVAGVAHEINNPVNFIYGNITYIRNYTKDLLRLVELYQQLYSTPKPEITALIAEIDLEFLTGDLSKILASMKVGAERIRELVLSLRNFSRLDEAEMKLVNIHEGIDSTLMLLQYRLKANIEIEVIKEYGDLPLVECYVAQMNQVFMYLLNNAIDALESSGQVTPMIKITTEVSNVSHDARGTILIRIMDNGPGMTEDVRSRIFDPFFTTKPVGQGVGLGLAISYQIIVETHHGNLQCFSRLGEGAEFLIEIPI